MEGIRFIEKYKYSLYCSCNPSTTGQAGTGVIIKKSAMNKILGFEPISVGMCKRRIKGKVYNITVTNINAATEDKEEDIKG